MNRIAASRRDRIDTLIQGLARRHEVDRAAVIPYYDHGEMLCALLRHFATSHETLQVAGYASPELAIAADRAGIGLNEVLGPSPFVSHAEDILETIKSGRELIYLANPNHVSGSSFSFAHLNRIVRALPNGRFILDEKYFDFLGISGLSLLDLSDRVMVMRSLPSGSGLSGIDPGYLIGPPSFVGRLLPVYDINRMLTRAVQSIQTAFDNRRAAENRLTQIHDEALRLATRLTELGVQNRMTTADFLLLRVNRPTQVGNYLATFATPIENLDGYPELKHYVRYRIQTPAANDDFLTAFSRMPSEYYQMPDVDHRAVMFHRSEPVRRGRKITCQTADKQEPVAMN